MSKATVKFGKIELEVNAESDTTFVPAESVYIDNKKILETLAYSIEKNLPTLIIGETGTGKTSAIRHLAHKTNNSFRRLNLNGATTVDEFVGKILIKDGSTYWTDGILTEAMRKGHWLLIDEINAGLPEVLFVLQSLLDDDGYIVLTDKEDKEVVRPHKDFRIFATMNPSEGYSGTKEMNKALMSRFSLVLTIDFLAPLQELKVMTAKLGIKEQEGIDKASAMIKLANSLRTSYKNHQLDFVMSTRELLYWYQMAEHTGDVIQGAKLSFLSKANSDDRDVIESILKVHFKSITGQLTEDILQELKLNQSVSVIATNSFKLSIAGSGDLLAPAHCVYRIDKVGNNDVRIASIKVNDKQIYNDTKTLSQQQSLYFLGQSDDFNIRLTGKNIAELTRSLGVLDEKN